MKSNVGAPHVDHLAPRRVARRLDQHDPGSDRQVPRCATVSTRMSYGFSPAIESASRLTAAVSTTYLDG